MRLFRGKRKDSGKWVYGYYYQIWDKVYILWGMTNGVPDMIEVIPETVGQSTGLKDKNGVEIYEGDVIKLHKDYRLSGLKPIPIKGSISFDKEGYWKCSNTILEEIPLDSFVIIGNVHEEAKR